MSSRRFWLRCYFALSAFFLSAFSSAGKLIYEVSCKGHILGKIIVDEGSEIITYTFSSSFEQPPRDVDASRFFNRNLLSIINDVTSQRAAFGMGKHFFYAGPLTRMVPPESYDPIQLPAFRWLLELLETNTQITIELDQQGRVIRRLTGNPAFGVEQEDAVSMELGFAVSRSFPIANVGPAPWGRDFPFRYSFLGAGIISSKLYMTDRVDSKYSLYMTIQQRNYQLKVNVLADTNVIDSIQIKSDETDDCIEIRRKEQHPSSEE